MELSRLEIAKLQKRAEDWEQKDVVAFEKTIADLREKLAAAETARNVTECISDNDLADKMLAAMKSAAHWKAEATTLGLQLAELRKRIEDREDFGSRVYSDRRHWKGRAGRAERELESYAATDRTASIALVDVTRERDDLQRQLDDARHDCGAPACTDDTPDEVCECGHAKSEHNHGQFSCWSNDDCKCVRYATPDPKPTDTTEMRRRADLYKYNPDDLRKFLLAACDALDEERLKNEARPREDMLIQHQIRKEG